MGDVKIVSWNVRGLNSKFKRALIFDYLNRHKPDLLFLQETHLVGQKLLALKKHWVRHAYHSPYSTYSRGVSVIVRKNLQFELLNINTDRFGRYVIIHCKINNQIMTLVNLYIPPPFNKEVLDHIFEKVSVYLPCPICFLGDFNTVVDPLLDRLAATTHQLSPLGKWLEALGLVDIWRHKYPSVKQFSCHSVGKNSLSRIDMVMGSPEFVHWLRNVSYLPRALSDHAPLCFSFCVRPLARHFIWRLSPAWLSNPDVAEACTSEYKTYWELNINSSSTNMVWEASKAAARGTIIAAVSQARAKAKQGIAEAEGKVQETEQILSEDNNETNHQALIAAQRNLELAQTTVTRKRLLYANQRVFDQGDKNGKVLAYLAKTTYASTLVPRIQINTDFYISEPEDIAREFAKFYADLYSSRAQYTETELDQFLSDVPFPRLSQADASLLDGPITVGEVAEAIGSLAPGKTPGPDGLPAAWYRLLSEDLTPQLHATFAAANDTGSLPQSFYTAIIVLIHKVGKNPELCDSYRPISLINTDVKILAKLLSRRLSKVISTIVHPDQTGFMPHKSTAINLRRLFSHLQADHRNTGSRTLVALDAAKAFDSVEWCYLWKTLEKFGIGPKFIAWLKLLYQQPVAQIRVNNVLSDSFPLSRGTRQGCPLSPLLFALAIEPYAIMVRRSPAVVGLKCGQLEEKIALYADDVLLFLDNPGDSLDNALKLADEFSVFSGLKINKSKSTLFSLDVPRNEGDILGLRWVYKFKYLGILVSSNLSDFIPDNIEPVIGSFKTAASQWVRLPLTVWGRVNLFKMVYLPKFLYVLQHAPMWLSPQLFHRIDAILFPYVWANKPPRVSRLTLMAPQELGGLALPNLRVYYYAAQLAFIHNWFCPDPENSLTALHATLAGSLEAIRNAPYRKARDTPELPPVLAVPQKVWAMAAKLFTTAPQQQSLQSPLWRNSNYPHLYSLQDFQYWPKRGLRHLANLLVNGEFPTMAQLKVTLNQAEIQFYRYLQLRHACVAQFGSVIIQTQMLPFETRLWEPEPKKVVSQLYKILVTKLSNPLEKARAKWSVDIPSLDGDAWEEVKANLYSSLISTRDKLVQFRIIHRTYLTPLRLRTMGRNRNANCPKCQNPDTGLFHMLWSCPVIYTYWTNLINYVTTQVLLPGVLTPEVCLMGLVDDLAPHIRTRTLLRSLLFYGRKLIALKWMSPTPPTVKAWIKLVNDKLPIIKLTYMARHCPQKFEAVWDPWLEICPEAEPNV